MQLKPSTVEKPSRTKQFGLGLRAHTIYWAAYILEGGASLLAIAREAAELATATSSYAAGDGTVVFAKPRSTSRTSPAALDSTTHVSQQYLAGANSRE